MNILISQGQSVLEIHTQKGLKLININRIRFVKAFNKGTVVYLVNLENIETNCLIKSYEKYLTSPNFFRCHNSYLINCNFVDCFCSNERYPFVPVAKNGSCKKDNTWEHINNFYFVNQS